MEQKIARIISKERFAINLQALRKNKGLNKHQASQEMNIAYSYLTDLERTDGKKNPSFETIDKIAKYYNVDIYELFL